MGARSKGKVLDGAQAVVWSLLGVSEVTGGEKAMEGSIRHCKTIYVDTESQRGKDMVVPLMKTLRRNSLQHYHS